MTRKLVRLPSVAFGLVVRHPVRMVSWEFLLAVDTAFVIACVVKRVVVEVRRVLVVPPVYLLVCLGVLGRDCLIAEVIVLLLLIV